MLGCTDQIQRESSADLSVRPGSTVSARTAGHLATVSRITGPVHMRRRGACPRHLAESMGTTTGTHREPRRGVRGEVQI